jgi:mannose-1-phosphate guanylyltransferase
MVPSLWSVVLAAGKGRRLSAVTGGTPKQFFRPPGSRSLLEETLARLTPLSGAARTVIVLDSGHRRYFGAGDAPRRGSPVFQPSDRGTAAGVLFGLVPVLAADPAAIVLLTPADHGVRHPAIFRRGIAAAMSHVTASGGVVLFGVEPSAASDDLGWISVDAHVDENGIRAVKGFVEKPPVTEARRLLGCGAAWNTMVLVASARDLLALSAAAVPELAAPFVQALSLAEAARDSHLCAAYPQLPVADFSRDILAGAQGLLAYTWPASMGWSDLGTPERLRAWQRTTAPAVGAQAGTSLLVASGSAAPV